MAKKAEVADMVKTAVVALLAGDVSEYDIINTFDECVYVLNERQFIVVADGDEFMVTISKPRRNPPNKAN